ncbi:cell division protein CrgA [Nocardioides jishulii]|uniref:Cell division protein CrgA n=1 Tax=Nocardioides jishulii TaxID=2575440 RepID=A0A4U2YRN4_9ACTN|nr:cell division protein CrgA [Nocardioides jishulii]QCX26122.1 cell division protein CrgA [Nocardioides jishulii]TKI64079.1 cell division protein CrgA [Nocardioides jishulii]
MSKPKAKNESVEPREKLVSVRLLIAVLLVVAGIAWIAYYYAGVRPDPTVFPAEKPGGPAFIADLGKWNYLIGFGAIIVGLMVSAHPSTPLGRGRGVVVGMLGCFLIGLLWICTFYIFSGDKIYDMWVFNDLQNYNLLVGIGFMAAGFSFATRWE